MDRYDPYTDKFLRDTQYNIHSTNLALLGTDAITKQQAIDALRKLREEDIEDYGCEIPEGFNQDHLDRATFAIKQLPPIQPKLLQPWEVLVAQAVLPQPKRGKWIEYEQKFMTDRPFETIKKHVRECSLCRTKIAGFDGTMRYCPNCGAKMDEVTT